ncbi:flagellar protein FlaR [Maritalea sp. S77]|uniref:flagellar protein FlaR n=1 Tax=Maritalea sp. S77 TaxID=3415125 RepID=UPI003C7ABD72
MTRVSVIGNAGGGKSTLCAAICAAHDLPNISIDHLQWQPGWVPTPKATFNCAHQSALSQDRWLIDGFGPWDSVVERLKASDTIIFVDHPLWLHYWWTTKRQIKSIFVGRPDGPNGCPMLPVTFRLYKMMWHVHRVLRPKLLAELSERAKTCRIIHIRSPRELNTFKRNPI